MFKRKPRSYSRTILEFFYPRGGWYRAAQYVLHRIRRLPDPAHRISRGIAIGVFVCFTPFFGLHFLTATILALALRGNVVAALLATFFGNPITFPIIAEISISLGSRMLDQPVNMHLPQVAQAFWDAIRAIGHNIMAMFTDEVADWRGIVQFWWRVMVPYTVGGLFPGVVTAAIAYYASLPVLTMYQKQRIKRFKKRYEARMRERAEAARREEE
ncbi:MAG: hypothetical protein CR993_04865 [Rhodobacterales bacterium]|nr:MAG: hypothetical protein CR993_04865 [Rhodobacterales bacterium]